MNEIVVIGASLAGLRAAEALRAEGHAGRIVIVGDEPHLPYDRPPLSKALLLDTGEPDACFLPIADDLDVEWELGVGAAGLDLASRRVGLADGRTLPFDGLVLACGTTARRPAFATGSSGVTTLRTLGDGVALRSRLRSTTRLAVVGAGFIGCEVAAAAREMGIDTTLVDVASSPLERVLGTQVGEACATLHREHGVRLRLGKPVAGLQSDGGAVAGVRLADGELIPADTVVVGVGAAPATGWLAGSGLDLTDGVLCDEALRVVGARDVVAAGDVARWPNPTYDGLHMRVEHWTHAAESAYAAASTLLSGDDAPAFSTVPSFWSDQYDVKLQSLGLPALGDECVLLEGDGHPRRLVAAYGREGRLVGAVAFNAPKALARLRRGIALGVALSELPSTGTPPSPATAGIEG